VVEIGDQRLEPTAVRAHLVAEGVQALAAARDCEHGMPPLGECQRELAAETGRGARNDRPTGLRRAPESVASRNEPIRGE
jgi:hypothetical protein